ncbi:uncharacterized protein LOC113766415 [Coffea eugenioides]|uniref:uncharacterized protein LOC113766415 n=1 Tax=Coffea eugenioides TaxID=49369 RepID=UPI000F607937|nr:uncharacterized protein LOC113766415 [Coffea eugenioides]
MGHEDTLNMKSTRFKSKRVPPTGAEPSIAAQPENTSEDQGCQWTQPANEETLARMAEFVAENPVGIINTIEGGPTGGDSQNSRKRTYRQANSDQVEPGSLLTEVITFGPNDPIPAASSNHETLVIEVLTNNYIVKNVYVNLENSVDIMYYRTFKSLKLTRDQLTSVRTPLVGFGGHVVHSEGMITLMVTIGCHLHCHTITVNFAVVKVDSPYNLLIGRPMLNALWAVYSTYHLSFKFLTPAGMAEVSSDVCVVQECYIATLQAATSSSIEPK